MLSYITLVMTLFVFVTISSVCCAMESPKVQHIDTETRDRLDIFFFDLYKNHREDVDTLLKEKAKGVKDWLWLLNWIYTTGACYENYDELSEHFLTMHPDVVESYESLKNSYGMEVTKEEKELTILFDDCMTAAVQFKHSIGYYAGTGQRGQYAVDNNLRRWHEACDKVTPEMVPELKEGGFWPEGITTTPVIHDDGFYGLTVAAANMQRDMLLYQEREE